MLSNFYKSDDRSTHTILNNLLKRKKFKYLPYTELHVTSLCLDLNLLFERVTRKSWYFAFFVGSALHTYLLIVNKVIVYTSMSRSSFKFHSPGSRQKNPRPEFQAQENKNRAIFIHSGLWILASGQGGFRYYLEYTVCS